MVDTARILIDIGVAADVLQMTLGPFPALETRVNIKRKFALESVCRGSWFNMVDATVKTLLFVCVALLQAYEIGCSADSYVVASRFHSEVKPGDSGQTTVDVQGAGGTAGGGAAGGTAGKTAGKTADNTPFRKDDTDENSAGLSPDQVAILKKGGVPGTVKWLYPYEGTVFPGDTLAPTLMWEGDPETRAIYLKIKSKFFDYQTIVEPTFEQPRFALGQTSDGLQPRYVIPQDIWDTACKKTQGKADLSDFFTLQLSTLVNGTVSTSYPLHITIAQTSVRGTVYYTGYAMSTSNSASDATGTLMIIPQRGRAGALKSDDVGGDCVGCHTIASNGSRLFAQTGQAGTYQGFSFQLDSVNGATNSRSLNIHAAGMGALNPDGSRYLAQSQMKGLTSLGCWTNYNWYNSQLTPVDATLYDTTTGAVIANTNIPPGAFMPMFSPDGTRLVFNDSFYEGHALVVMNYDNAHDKASASKVLWQEQDSAGATRPAWPSFLPDNRAVVFQRTDAIDFCGTYSQFGTAATDYTKLFGIEVSDMAPKSELYVVDVKTGKETVLAKAMGFNTLDDYKNEITYLPFGADDLYHNYNSTVSPVASGGYFWVFFDSPRNYGNLGLTRGIWGIAIDIQPSNGTYTKDPSHPPFYLPGQDLDSSNHRAFSVLNRCKELDGLCSIGIDCCTGFCSASSPSSDGKCIPHRTGCSKRDEHCDASTDCCETNDYCIRGFCAYVQLL